MPDTLKCDPGQILISPDTPKTQPIKAAGKGREAGLERYRNMRSCGALRLLDDVSAVAEHDNVGLSRRERRFERVKQRQPFGVTA